MIFGKKKKIKAPKSGKNPNRKPIVGSLMLIAMMLAGAGAIRLGQGISYAFANASDLMPEPPPGEQCVTEDGLLEMLRQMRARNSELDELETQLSERSQKLDEQKMEIDAELVKLQAAKEDLARYVEVSDKGAEEDVQKLVALYENMKPKQATPLFQAMSPDFAAGFLARMKPASAAAILSGLPPETAYTISVLMAGRNANAPRE